MNNLRSIAVYCMLIVICCTLKGLVNGSPYSPMERKQDLSSQSATDSHIRRKRHTPDHLITDRRAKQMRFNERSLVINKLIQLASPDSCKCKISRNAIDDRSRSREKLRRLRGGLSRGCTCDMLSTLRQLFRKMLKSGKRNHGNDSISKYLSTLDDKSKMILRRTLADEIIRLRQIDNLRKLRRAKMQRRRLRRNPHRALHGLNLFMGWDCNVMDTTVTADNLLLAPIRSIDTLFLTRKYFRSRINGHILGECTTIFFWTWYDHWSIIADGFFVVELVMARLFSVPQRYQGYFQTLAYVGNKHLSISAVISPNKTNNRHSSPLNIPPTMAFFPRQLKPHSNVTYQ